MVDPPNLAPFGPCLIPNSLNAGGLTCPLGKFYTIFLKHFGDVHKIPQIIFCLRPLLCLRNTVTILVNYFGEGFC